MKLELLDIIRCPKTGQSLFIESPEYCEGEIKSGRLVSDDGRNEYTVRDFIPRFVPESNYASNFGLQWNKFRKTQLDSYSGHPISATRFWRATGWTPTHIAGKWVLDAGCGAGRFAEIALEAGAKVLALDYSSAVDACYSNLRRHHNFHVVQGDIFALPIRKSLFPYVYSLGVLQHTPEVSNAFRAVASSVAPGGRLCVD